MLTTDLTLHLGTGENAIEVGLSTTLNNLTVDDLTDDIVNVGATDDRVEISSIWSLTATSGIPIAGDGVSMYSYEKNNYTGWYLDGNQGYSCGFENEYHNGIYIRSMFALVGANYQGLDTDIFTRNSDSVRLVTNMDISKVFLYSPLYDRYNIPLSDDSNLNDYVYNRYFSIRNKSDNGGIADEGYTLYNIVPVWLIVRDNDFVIWSGGMSKYFDNYGNRGTYGNGTTQDTKTFNADKSFSAQPLMYDNEDVPIYADTHEYKYRNEKSNYKVIWSSGGISPYYWTQNAVATKQMNMNQASWSGLFFKIDLNGKMYKPIISNGIVTGYTDDLTVESDIDNWTNINNHNISPTPPGPEPSDDYPDDKSDNISFGGAYAGLGAFAKFYLCSGLTIAGLSTWINGRDPSWPEGFDPMNQIIGLSRFATDLSSASYGSTTIKFHTADGTTIDTNLSALHGNGDNIELDLGSVNIPLRMQDRGVPFLDYSSTVELYIPACGTFQLDPQTILGSTLNVKMWLSTATGECSAIAYVSRGGANNPVAYGSGSLAVPMPISSNGWGAYQAALTNLTIKESFGSLQAIPALVQGMGALSGDLYVASGGASTLVGALQGLAQSITERQHVKNSSYTSVSGSFGSTASWNYPFNAYIKITRPRYRKPENYGHTQGIPLVATKTLSECSGYTVCVGTDVSSINATVNEKNQIIGFLSSGVIV